MNTTLTPRSKSKTILSAWFILAILFTAIIPAASAATMGPNHFEPLKHRILTDPEVAVSPEVIDSIFSDSRLFFETRGISSYFRHRESTLNYDQFVSEPSIKNALTYLETHKDALTRAEKKYQVDREIITAILLVETRLGTFTGNQKAVNILGTMAALTDKETRDIFYAQIPEDGRITRERYDSRADARGEWAYRELKALIKYTARDNFNIFEIESSYAGAVGFAQFMPSNILILGVDANNSGRVNLFEHDDAIFSIANYLRHHGWRPGLERDEAQKVLLHYNRSTYYANILLRIYDRLKEKS